jgi:hypothetical protein
MATGQRKKWWNPKGWTPQVKQGVITSIAVIVAALIGIALKESRSGKTAGEPKALTPTAADDNRKITGESKTLTQTVGDNNRGIVIAAQDSPNLTVTTEPKPWLLEESAVKRIHDALGKSPKFPVHILYIMGSEGGTVLGQQLISVFKQAGFRDIKESPGSDWIPALKGVRVRLNPMVIKGSKVAIDQILDEFGLEGAVADPRVAQGEVRIEIGTGWKPKG